MYRSSKTMVTGLRKRTSTQALAAARPYIADAAASMVPYGSTALNAARIIQRAYRGYKAYGNKTATANKRTRYDPNFVEVNNADLTTGAAHSGKVTFKKGSLKRKSKKAKKLLKKKKRFAKKVKNIIGKWTGSYMHKYKTHSYNGIAVGNGKVQKYMVVPYLFHAQLSELWNDVYERGAATGVTVGENKNHFYHMFVKTLHYRANITCMKLIHANFPVICDIYYWVCHKKLWTQDFADIQTLAESAHVGDESKLLGDTAVSANYYSDFALNPFLNKAFTKYCKIIKQESHIMTVGQTIQLNETVHINKWWTPEKGRMNVAGMNDKAYAYPDFTFGLLIRCYDAGHQNEDDDGNVLFHTGSFDVTYTGKIHPSPSTFNVLTA